jgi:hypothetical protein
MDYVYSSLNPQLLIREWSEAVEIQFITNCGHCSFGPDATMGRHLISSFNSLHNFAFNVIPFP